MANLYFLSLSEIKSEPQASSSSVPLNMVKRVKSEAGHAAANDDDEVEVDEEQVKELIKVLPKLDSCVVHLGGVFNVGQGMSHRCRQKTFALSLVKVTLMSNMKNGYWPL
jgi:hypothetical protein